MALVSLRGTGTSAGITGFNLEVADRELLILTGPAGSGKSAVLRAIAGLDPILAGEVWLGERRLNGLAPADREVALTFRSYALFPHLSVEENMAFGLKLRHYPRAEVRRRVQEVAGILELTPVLAQKPAQLSGAQRHRVALGRALVRQPKVYLLEDPFHGVEAAARAQARLDLVKLHERLQTTMLVTTPEPLEALALGGRVGVLRDGGVQQIAAPRTLFAEPKNAFVAGFLGAPGMNLLSGKIGTGKDGRLLFKETAGGALECPLEQNPSSGLKEYLGKEVLLGFRPEDFDFSPEVPAAGATTFPAVIEAVEIAGAESLLYLETGKHRLICRSRTAGGSRNAGHRARFAIDMARVQLFDATTSERIV